MSSYYVAHSFLCCSVQVIRARVIGRENLYVLRDFPWYVYELHTIACAHMSAEAAAAHDSRDAGYTDFSLFIYLLATVIII